ncbi:FAD-dependent oxidoreductase [Pseudonocardia sp. ICBG1293]|uniref:FAD-dependent oxidoreductase n=1 Tax=Pseudonocardia sp. ICBG1293 TaxID=2844382 RepID=UPI001CCB87CC|nr:FAD-dependent oxidoreductase [Pseudonocardia sp. ICBG1293]
MSEASGVPGLRISRGPQDPRLEEVDTDFRALLDEFGALTRTGRLTRRRIFHPRAAVLRGSIRFVEAPGVGVHPFFGAGRTRPVLARYSSGGSADDLAPGTRGVTLRWLDPDDRTDGGPSPLTLTFNTGDRLFAPDLATFVRFMLARGDDERAALVGALPPDTSAVLWDQVRDPLPLQRYHYHSQVPRIHVDATGRPWLARYRLVPDDGGPDLGHHDPAGRPVPPLVLLRDPAERRSPTALRDDLCRHAGTGSVRALLQLQLHPLGTDADANRGALSPAAYWPETVHPFRTIGELRLDAAVDEPVAEDVSADPAVAPEGLGLALARSPYEAASVEHGRALIYRAAHAARTRRGAPQAARDPRADLAGASGRTVCVIGAGPAGLTAAHELERLGHRVVVLERAREVGGRSVSVSVDGRPYDLGAHLCTARYSELVALTRELGLDTEDMTLTQIHETTTHTTRLPGAAFFSRDGAGRYARLRDGAFPDIAGPGLAHSARALAGPTRPWLSEHGIGSMADSFGAGYTASGYGYLADDLPALYFVKHAEMTGLLSPDTAGTRHDGPFTVAGGFGALWRRLAERLADVRTGVEVTAVDRSGDRVEVRTTSGTVRADDLVLAVPIDRLSGVLDTTPAEEAVAGRVRYVDYHTVLCRISGLPRDGLYLVDDGDGAPPRGHCVAYHHRHPGTDVYTCYSYGAPEGEEAPDVTATLREDVARLGGEVTEVLLARRWSFLPHFGGDDLADGIYDRLDALQGRRRTYHVGALPAFDLIETTVAHARSLVRNRFATGAHTPVPSSDGTVAGGERPGRAPDAAGIRSWLVGRLAAELGVEPDEIDVDAPLDHHPLDSLAVAGLQAELSDWLGLRVPATMLLDQPTLAATAARLAGSLPGAGTSAPPAGAAPPYLAVPLTSARPFFCVGGSAGSAHQLLPLARALGPWQPFVALQAPGYDGAEAVLDTVEAIAERYLADIRSVQPRGPYLVGGYSFGGLVAYEIGRRLRDAGDEVGAVVLIDSLLPAPGQTPPAHDEGAALDELVAVHRAMAGRSGDDLLLGPGPTTAQRREAACAELTVSGVVGAGAQLDRILPVYQSNLEANVRYRPPASDLPVTLLRAADPFPPVMRADRRPHTPPGDPAHGWGRVQAGGLQVVEVPGNHFTVFAADRVRGLADALARVLHEVPVPAGQPS